MPFLCFIIKQPAANKEKLPAIYQFLMKPEKSKASLRKSTAISENFHDLLLSEIICESLEAAALIASYTNGSVLPGKRYDPSIVTTEDGRRIECFCMAASLNVY